MFLQASVILFTGGVPDTPRDTPPRADTHPLEQMPPGADTPRGRHTPLEQTPPRADTPPRVDKHPQSRHTPLEQTHPTRADTLPREQTPWSRHPPDQVHPPESRHPTSGSRHTPPPRADQVHPLSRHPLGPGTPPLGPGTPPCRRAGWEIRSTCGWYASYWNAILFYYLFRAIYLMIIAFKNFLFLI